LDLRRFSAARHRETFEDIRLTSIFDFQRAPLRAAKKQRTHNPLLFTETLRKFSRAGATPRSETLSALTKRRKHFSPSKIFPVERCANPRPLRVLRVFAVHFLILRSAATVFFSRRLNAG
jgi:hypothetical protein